MYCREPNIAKRVCIDTNSVAMEVNSTCRLSGLKRSTDNILYIFTPELIEI